MLNFSTALLAVNECMQCSGSLQSRRSATKTCILCYEMIGSYCCKSTANSKYFIFYSGGQLRWDGNNISFCVSTTTEIMKTINVPMKSPIKLLPEMKKKLIFQKLLVLGHFLKKQSFQKMGVADINWGPYPSTILLFLVNPNEEPLLKVSFKNIDWFQSCIFLKTLLFRKRP